jgi:hypothetical protein
MRILQIGNSDTLKLLLLVPYDIEKEMHGRFFPYHIRGEWFSPAKAILDLVKWKRRRIARQANSPRKRNAGKS